MLYLHIGMDKAGSTTIQKFMTEYSDKISCQQLQSLGIGCSWKLGMYINTEKSNNYWINRRNISPSALDYIRRNLLNEVKNELRQSRTEAFLASSEYIFGLTREDPVATKNFYNSLREIFDKVKIILYLRPQHEFILSHYAQLIKGGYKECFDTFIQYYSKERLWDYLSIVSMWLDIAGDEYLDLVCFSKENFLYGRLEADFSSRINSFWDESMIVRNQNKSPGYLQLEFMRLANQLNIQKDFSSLIDMSPLSSLLDKNKFPDEMLKKIEELSSIYSYGNEVLNLAYFNSCAKKLMTSNMES